MRPQLFSKPVPVFVGMGFPRDIVSVVEAYEKLNEWPGSRSPAFTAALCVCQSALVGDKDVETARIAFEAFALARGILAPDALEVAAARAADEWLTA
ncbi:DUF982 domain-containing protein [Mesorhizobium sp. Cs1299R1N1]|uniref:DUF982 domain-containing protein n=1 Tax=Mesorhizobium sp. Cs1299R1N1 TaxID=3015172 RepID=UPI00301C17C7